jgi:long-chain acyl-CoA synthetase
LLVRGPQIMSGYWGHPDETARVLEDGWMRTGDVARIDADGCYYIVDRLKDMILVDTLNVYPSVVEGVLRTHPRVREAAVIGRPDERHGQRVTAVIVPEGEPDDALTGDILEHCRAHLAPFKVPTEVEYRADLPKSALGKIQRRDLRPS